jgi:tryptophanyl-tRNA synthetase
MKSVLVSGIQPTGRLHLGNYLGALKNFVGLQNSRKYQCYFFIADLHSLTEQFEPRTKVEQILELAADYLAAGLDPKTSVIFLQSAIPAHSELTELLTAITPEGELRRMTQYKDKVVIKKRDANAGLLMYPLLMTADVILYDARFVPVGDDQLQHLELARTLVRKFNKKFGKTFVEPQPLLTGAPRVMSLANPTKKMSKSEPAGCLFLDDSPVEIKKKTGRAVTDSGTEIKYDATKKPGISNLLTIYAALEECSIERAERRLRGKSYAEFKAALAKLIADHFADYRKEKKKQMANRKSLIATLKNGSIKAQKVAARKLAEVKKKIGIAL